MENGYHAGMMKILGNRALLEPLTPPTMSRGGVVFAPQHVHDQMQYRVLATGRGKRLKDGRWLAPPVRDGDRCLLNPNHVGVIHRFDDGRIIVDCDRIEMKWQLWSQDAGLGSNFASFEG